MKPKPAFVKKLHTKAY